MFSANRWFNGKRRGKVACGCSSKRGRFLRMESLEDRRLLSGDPDPRHVSDAGSLYNAIIEANGTDGPDDIIIDTDFEVSGAMPTITESLYIYGNSHTISHNGSYSPYLFYMDAADYLSGNLELANLTISGFGSAIGVDLGRNIVALNCQFLNNLNAGIEIGTDLTTGTIESCYVDGCGFYGNSYGIRANAQVSSILGIEVTDSYFGSTTQAGNSVAAMAFKGSGQRTITNNQIVGGGYGITAQTTTGSSGYTFDIQNNTFGVTSDLSTVKPNSRTAISIDNTGSTSPRYIDILNNYLWGNGCTISGGALVQSSTGGDGIALSNCHDVTISGNNIGGYKSGSSYIELKNGGFGVSLGTCTDVTFTANIVVGNEYSGLWLNACETVTVTANASSVANEFVYNGADTTTSISTSRSGISVNNSDDVTITSTLFNQNLNYGVEVGSGSTDIVIANSTFFANVNDAIATLTSDDDQVLVDNNSYQYTSYYSSSNVPIDLATDSNSGITTPTIDALGISGSTYLAQLTANLPSTFAGATVSFEIYRYQGSTYYGRYDALGSASGTLDANGDLTGVVTLPGLVAGDQFAVHITIPSTGTLGRSSEFCAPVTLPAVRSTSRFSADSASLANTAVGMTVQSLTFIPASGASREWDWLFAGHGSEVPAVRLATTPASAVDSVLTTGWNASEEYGYDDTPDNDAFSSHTLDDALLEPLFSGPKGGLGF